MPCDICVLRPAPAAATLDEFLDSLRSCTDCPLLNGPTAEPTAVFLVERLLEAGRELRRTHQRLRRSEVERRELGAAVHSAEERAATLTHVQESIEPRSR